MKILHHTKARIFEYCIIIIVFVLPPIFTLPARGFSEGKNIPPSLSFGGLIFYAAAAVFLYRRAERALAAVPGRFSIKKIFESLYKMIICYCALLTSALFWNYAAKITGNAELPSFIVPHAFDKRLLLYVSAIVLASYEEMLFRFFLPERGLALIKSFILQDSYPADTEEVVAKKSQFLSFLTAAAELIPIVLFALAHRYLGTYAVGNALCAAIILRLALYKNLHIAALCAVHAAYNITIFIALSCMRS